MDALHGIAAEQRVLVSAVALAWVTHRPGFTVTIIGCRTIDQLENNLASLTVAVATINGVPSRLWQPCRHTISTNVSGHCS